MSTLTFHQALLQAETQARSTLAPGLHERLSAAVALVSEGRVFQATDGTWQVDSSSTEGLTYSVNGSCSCEDHHYNKPAYCKHQLAMFLSRRALQVMQAPPAHVVSPAEPAPDAVSGDAHTPAPLPEAPASVNVRLHIDGRECQLTLRDHDETRLLARLQAVLARYPVPTPSPAVQGQPQGTGKDFCAIHQVRMKETTKDGRSWFSHRTDQGWCKGRPGRGR
jgi:hypothetical protein